MQITHTHNIKRFWLSADTPLDILDTVNHRIGLYKHARCPYVDIYYVGAGHKYITTMELRYSDYIIEREDLTVTIEGDDGL